MNCCSRDLLCAPSATMPCTLFGGIYAALATILAQFSFQRPSPSPTVRFPRARPRVELLDYDADGTNELALYLSRSSGALEARWTAALSPR